MVEVDMPEHAVVGFVAMSEVLTVLFNSLVVIFLMPILYLLCHLRIDIAVLVDEINTFIQVDDDVEERIHSLSRLEHGGHHRHTKQLAELLVVDGIAPFLKFVVHIQRTNHARVHVDELGCEIEITLQVACVEHVENDVGSLVDNLPSDVHLLR